MRFTGNEAREWAEKGDIAGWVQRFLRNDEGEHANPNIGFADGLLIEERFYIGPVSLPLDALATVRVGENISDAREMAEFRRKVNAIAALLPEWDMPPFIVQYWDGALKLTDGNHRFTALREAGATHADAIVWGSAQYEAEARTKIESVTAD